MFTSIITNNTDFIVNYVNAMPGTGKTWTFDHKVAVPHVKETHNSLLVYAAPTNALLDEREESLLSLGIPRSRLVRIDAAKADRNVVLDFMQVTMGIDSTRSEVDGTIILCTHECIARIPKTMVGKERCVLVYDEARSCLETTLTMTVNKAVYDYLLHPTANNRVPFINQLPVFSGEDDSLYIWRWTNPSVDMPVKELKDLAGSMPASKFNRLIALLNSTKNTSLDVYVSAIERSNSYTVYTVMNPSRMFIGFNKVLILSALFESSQMYHFLRMPVTRGRSPDIHDITYEYVDPVRVRKLRKRMKYVSLTYVMDRKSAITKTQLYQGLVVSWNIGKIRSDWTELYGGHKADSYRKGYKYFVDSLHGARSPGERRRRKVIDFMAGLANEGKIHGGVLKYLIHTSVQLHKAFLGEERKRLPLGVNAKLGGHKTWEFENLDALRREILQVPISAHGLNKFKHYRTCAFLASMRYSALETQFLKKVIPDYDANLDRTLAYALQMLWRCNVRLVSKKTVLLIVTDCVLAEALADKVADFYGQRVLRVVPPDYYCKVPDVKIITYSPPLDPVYHDRWSKSTLGRIHKELAATWRRTATGRKYNALSSNISYRRKLGCDVISLLKERTQYLSLSQWKKTEEGIRAYKALIKDKFNPTVAARKALSKINGDTLTRNDRLKVLSILKRTNPELKELARAWYPGDKFDSNWRSAEKYGTTLTLGWLFRLAKD